MPAHPQHDGIPTKNQPQNPKPTKLSRVRFYDRQGYFSSPSMSRMGPEYTARLDAFLSPGVLLGFDIAAVLLGLIGGVIALRLLRKNFARAGLA